MGDLGSTVGGEWLRAVMVGSERDRGGRASIRDTVAGSGWRHALRIALLWRRVRMESERIHNGAMAVTLSVKNVPEKLAERLRQRAARNHRSLQGELMAILEDATRPGLTIDDLAERVKALGLKTPAESAAMIRADRDGRRR